MGESSVSKRKPNQKTIVMSDEEALIFIDKVKLYPAIWDTKSADYKNLQKKTDAWNTVSASGCYSVEELKSKWKSLRGTYRKLRSVYKNSMVTGSARTDVERPSWFAYEALEFSDPQEADSEDIGMPDVSSHISNTHEIDHPYFLGATPAADEAHQSRTPTSPALEPSIQPVPEPRAKSSRKRRLSPDDLDVEISGVLKELNDTVRSLAPPARDIGRYLNDTINAVEPDIAGDLVIEVEQAITKANIRNQNKKRKITIDKGTNT